MKKKKMNREDKVFNTIGILVFSIITLICFYPFYYLLICTISDQQLVNMNQIMLSAPTYGCLNILESFQLKNTW